MNPKALIPLIAGLAIAGLAAKLGLDFVKRAQGQQPKAVELWTPVQDVKRGVAIDESMLQPLPFPADIVPPGALAEREKIVGRVPHTGAPAGVPVLDSMLLPPGVSAGIRVPPGLRAVAVKIDEGSGVDYHLEPGCRVDVVGVFSVRRKNRAETLARTILENVEVAAVGQRLAPSAPTPSDEKKKSSRRERPARAVTLLVKPKDVPRLHLAEQKGKIKLSMRGALDQGRGGKAARVNEDELLGLKESQPEAPPPSWGDRFNDFVSSFWKKDKPEPIEEVKPVQEPPPVVKPEPKLAWVMAVYNGEERRLLGWKNLNDFQPIELSSEGPNIFQDEPRLPPGQPKPGWQTESKPGQESQVNPPPNDESKSRPEPEPQTDSEAETESEPQELFE